MELLFFVCELIGTAAFSASGAMIAMKRDMDLFGVCILGLTTAVGGGIIRDIALGITPPSAFYDPIGAMVAIGTAAFLFLPMLRRRLFRNLHLFNLILFLFDTLGLGIFTVAGIRATYLAVEMPSLFLLAFAGTVTGVGGGALRDVMADGTPSILVKHVYASASLAGALICALLWEKVGELPAMLCGLGVIALIRGLSAHFRWELPHSFPKEETLP